VSRPEHFEGGLGEKLDARAAGVRARAEGTAAVGERYGLASARRRPRDRRVAATPEPPNSSSGEGERCRLRRADAGEKVVLQKPRGMLSQA
jgi:hypothetical protein